MKKRYMLIGLMAALVLPLSAQGNRQATLDTYAGANLATEDLNGSARYVGMGGAMEALGADLSTIGTNPAGIGLFRKSQVSASFGLVSQQDGKSFQSANKTNASFDQIGFVWASRTGQQSFLNVGFNYHKSRNFDYVLSAAASLNGSAQNKQTTIKGIRGDLDTRYGESQIDNLYYNLVEGEQGELYTYDATSYEFDRAHTGYIGEYDFNISGNINNRVYLGLTVGIHDVHYKGYSEYFETLAPNADDISSVLISDDHRITGTGYDLKAGIILRPVEESPFRLGVSVATPTWYKLTTENYTQIGDVAYIADTRDFRFNTPWKFGVSAGHTIGTQIALGATYEYADYSTCDMRVIDGSYYDYWDDYYSESSSSDPVMKRHTQNTLKGVSTVKVGGEFKPDPNIAIRLGYNYVSPMYKKEGVRDQTLDAPGVYMASTTDYVNWKATNRITAGVGLTFNQLRLDVAYQYSTQDGDFYPFMPSLSGSYTDSGTGTVETLTNSCQPEKVSNNRHQLLCTLSYTF